MNFGDKTMDGKWTSLEVAKLAASIATPLAIALFGIYFHRLAKRFEHSQWRNQKLIEKRIAVYDSLAPQFNDLLCYFTFVGSWKEFDPPAVVAMKRDVDKKIHMARPLFSPIFFDTCMAYMSTCFHTFQGWGQDAKLRSKFQRRRDAHPRWDPAWEACFSDQPSHPKAVFLAYERLMATFASEIGFVELPPPLPKATGCAEFSGENAVDSQRTTQSVEDVHSHAERGSEGSSRLPD